MFKTLKKIFSSAPLKHAVTGLGAVVSAEVVKDRLKDYFKATFNGELKKEKEGNQRTLVRACCKLTPQEFDNFVELLARFDSDQPAQELLIEHIAKTGETIDDSVEVLQLLASLNTDDAAAFVKRVDFTQARDTDIEAALGILKKAATAIADAAKVVSPQIATAAKTVAAGAKKVGKETQELHKKVSDGLDASGIVGWSERLLRGAEQRAAQQNPQTTQGGQP